jgi:hypothetical protein
MIDMSEPNNVISLAEWKANHQRKPVVWTYYCVVPDPTQPHGWQLELIHRKLNLDLD